MFLFFIALSCNQCLTDYIMQILDISILEQVFIAIVLLASLCIWNSTVTTQSWFLNVWYSNSTDHILENKVNYVGVAILSMTISAIFHELMFKILTIQDKDEIILLSVPNGVVRWQKASIGKKYFRCLWYCYYLCILCLFCIFYIQ